MKENNKLNKCPNCNSKRLKTNEKGEIKCYKCGYIHSMNKSACFVEFTSLG